MKEVTQKQFYNAIGPLNVHPHIKNSKWPYTSDFLTPNGQFRGRVVNTNEYKSDDGKNERKYYLPE
jgi:hypothetical protein